MFIHKLHFICFVSLSAVDRLEEALQCALTYLLFHEGDEFIMDNVDYYREELGHDGGPREVRVSCYRGLGRGG